MFGSRKKQLLDSLKTQDQQQQQADGCDVTSLNVNQPLTDQLTQQRRLAGSERIAVDQSTVPLITTRSQVDSIRSNNLSAGRSSPSSSSRSSRQSKLSCRPYSPPVTSAAAHYDTAAAAALDRSTLSRLAAQQQQQQQQAAAAALRLQLPPAAAILSPYLLQPDCTATRQLELLYQLKYPRHPVPPSWMLHQFQDELIRDGAALLQVAAADREQHEVRRDNDRAIKDRHDREKQLREFEQSRSSVADSREQRGAGAAFGLGLGTGADKRRPVSGHCGWTAGLAADRERSLIVDQAGGRCVADAVDHHFNESLARLASYKATHTVPSVQQPWNPAVPSPLQCTSSSSSSSSVRVLPVQSGVGSLVPAGLKKIERTSTNLSQPLELISSSQLSVATGGGSVSCISGSSSKSSSSTADKMKYEEKCSNRSSRSLVDDSRVDMTKLDDRLRVQYDDKARYLDQNPRSIKYEDQMKLEERLKFEEQSRLDERFKLEERYRETERFRIADEQQRYNERVKLEEQRSVLGDRIEPICGDLRPRPAHNGAATNGPYGLGASVKPRHSPGPYGSSGSSSAKSHHSPVSRQGAAPSSQAHSAELNFNLYGYQPYAPVYISHEKLNHALSTPKDLSTADSGRPIRQQHRPLVVDDNVSAAKHTSVIVEHHSRHLTVVDPYRNRGSITHGTAATRDDTSIKLVPGYSLPTPRSVPSSRPSTDEVPWTKGKPTCVVNGLCWSGAQTLPTASNRSTSPNKTDLIKQGLVPNPLYSSSISSRLETPPVATLGGLDLTAAAAAAAADTRWSTNSVSAATATVASYGSKKPSTSNVWVTASTGASTQVSYIDSFKSFVDHAVQNAFLNELVTSDSDSTAHETHQLATSSTETSTGQQTRSVLQALSTSTSPTLTQTISSRPGPNMADVVVRSAESHLPTDITSQLQSNCQSTANQMPALVSSVTTASSSICCLPSAVSPKPPNHGPPLLVPQQPIESVARCVSNVADLCQLASRQLVADADSDTLSAHSPAPVLLPMSNTPEPVVTTNSRHVKKSWLLRYSDEDRGVVTSDPTEDRIDTVDTVAMETDDAAAKGNQQADESGDKSVGQQQWPVHMSSTDSPSANDGQLTDNCHTGSSDTSYCSSMTDSSADSKETGSCRSGNGRKVASADDKESVRNCYINCSYLSEKDLEPKSPSRQRIVKDSTEDKDEISQNPSESDDSQLSCSQSRKRKSSRTKRTTTEIVAVKKTKICGNHCSGDSGNTDKLASATRQCTALSNNNKDTTASTARLGTEIQEFTGTKKSSNLRLGSATKLAKTVSLPLSDCEAKIAARLKELKGKPRCGSLSAVLENKPLNQCTSEVRRKKSREPFVQDGPCCDVTPKLMKCRECKMSSHGQRNSNTSSSQMANNIFCRFYAFRKLCYSAKGMVTVSGFCKPTDADADDVELWLPPTAAGDQYLSIELAKYIVSLLSDCFIKMIEDEKDSLELGKVHATAASNIVWKRAIQGVREMCDVCDATLFNVHWTCAKCGFAVCPDCFQLKSNLSTQGPSDDKWMTCSSNRQPHELDGLMTTQIIPSDVLLVLRRMLDEVMTKWHLSSVSRHMSVSTVNGLGQTSSGKLMKTRKKKPLIKDGEESVSLCTVPCSTVNVEVDTEQHLCVNGSVELQPVNGVTSDHIVRMCKLVDNGHLLRLADAKMSSDDMNMFHEHWQKALPVLVTRSQIWFRSELWRPSALARCGGFPAVDSVSGADIPASRFWDHFEKTAKVSASLPRQKDWPTPDDLPLFTSHLHDLDSGLPLPEYTRTNGALHPISHLPEYFVRPELSVLRLNAGRSSGVPSQVAPLSKLHVDATDSCSAVVYVSAATESDDVDSHKNNNAVRLSLDAAGCSNFLTSFKSTRRPIAAVWHVYRPHDAEKIRIFLNKFDTSAGAQLDYLTTPTVYLDSTQRLQLLTEYDVQCSTIVQCLGDVVFVPALAPYQVCCIRNCVIASREFMSPESLQYCHSVSSLRRSQHNANAGAPTVFEDHLQGKNLIYHAVKDAIAVLQSADP